MIKQQSQQPHQSDQDKNATTNNNSVDGSEPDRDANRQVKAPSSDATEIASLKQQLDALKQQNAILQEKERRAIADYQNLLRRQQDERQRLVKMAGLEIVESLLQPFEHLQLAAEQLNDQGLNMVVNQFRQALAEVGLEEIEVMGKRFDYNLMEAVEQADESTKVVKVVRRGYKLNGEVIQHAKVILG
ncbi:MAG: nucleotide exchange factor GrpE [Patescibacteria group bacterium]